MRRIRQYFISLALLLSLSNLALADDIEIAITDVPPAVTQAVKTKYPNAEIQKAEKAIEDGRLDRYEIKLKLPNGEMHEVDVSPTGKIVNDRSW